MVNGLADGRQIRAAREALGWSQAEFADGAGVSHEAVYRAEGLARSACRKLSSPMALV